MKRKKGAVSAPNWRKLIRELNKAGLTQEIIAERVGATQENISRYKTGKSAEPHYVLGTRLVQLHRKEMMKKRRREQRKAKSAGLFPA